MRGPGGQGRGRRASAWSSGRPFLLGREPRGLPAPRTSWAARGRAGGAEAGCAPCRQTPRPPSGACAPSSVGTGVCVPTRPPPRTPRALGGPVGAARASRAGPEQPPRVLATAPGSGVGTRGRCGPGHREPAGCVNPAPSLRGTNHSCSRRGRSQRLPRGPQDRGPPGPGARRLPSLGLRLLPGAARLLRPEPDGHSARPPGPSRRKQQRGRCSGHVSLARSGGSGAAARAESGCPGPRLVSLAAAAAPRPRPRFSNEERLSYIRGNYLF